MPLVSNAVWNIQELQNSQKDIWKAVQSGINEAKNKIAMAISNIQSGNDKLKTVTAGIPCRSVLFR